jgi:hypothetical protein
MLQLNKSKFAFTRNPRNHFLTVDVVSFVSMNELLKVSKLTPIQEPKTSETRKRMDRRATIATVCGEEFAQFLGVLK